MSISKDEAIAELRRRNLPIPGEQTNSNAGSNVSREEAMEELNIRGVNSGGKATTNPIMNFLNQTSRQADKFRNGIAQPWVESGIFGQRPKEALRELEEQSRAKAMQSSEGNPISTELGAGFGQSLKSIPGMAIGGGAGKELLPHAPKLFRYLAGILGSGGLGALQGHGTEYVNPGESRMDNALTQGITNAVGTAAAPPLGFLAQKGVQLAKDTGKLIKYGADAIDTEGLIKNYLAAEKKVGRESSKQYKAIRHAAQEDNILTEVPEFIEKSSNKGLSKGTKEVINKYKIAKDIPSAHDAYKQLGQFIRNQSEKLEKGLLDIPAEDALMAAKKAQHEISESMHAAFKKYDRHDLSDALTDANNFYKTKVLAYENPLTGLYKERPKKLTDWTYVNKLSRSEPFKANLTKEHPALQVRGQMPELLGKLTGLGLSGAGLNYLFGGRNEK